MIMYINNILLFILIIKITRNELPSVCKEGCLRCININ